MKWDKVLYTFFALMSLTTTAGFLYDQNEITLFIAASVNLISTLLKIGVRNMLSAELFASSLVADLHLIPAFVMLVSANGNTALIYSLAIGGAIANIFSLFLLLTELGKIKEEF